MEEEKEEFLDGIVEVAAAAYHDVAGPGVLVQTLIHLAKIDCKKQKALLHLSSFKQGN